MSSQPLLPLSTFVKDHAASTLQDNNDILLPLSPTISPIDPLLSTNSSVNEHACPILQEINATAVPSTTVSTSGNVAPSLPSNLSLQDPIFSAVQDSSPPVPTLTEAPPATTSNVHQMLTRSKCGIHKPKAFVSTIVQQSLLPPKTYKSALKSPPWHNAMIAEIDALKKNGTWSLVPPPSLTNIVDCKWLFKIKYNPDGSIDRHKARLVARGFTQTQGVDSFDTFSPVVKPATVRVLLTMALSRNWPLRQIDIHNAFLNGDLTESVYMAQPPGFIDPLQPTFVCKLQKALYGLKQAPRAWYSKLSATLVSWGFSHSKSDPSLFIQLSASVHLLLIVYVDDIIITGSSAVHIDSLVNKLHQTFTIRDLGRLHYFLGIEVTYSTNQIHLCQQKYITDLLASANLLDSKPTPTPGSVTKPISKFDGIPLEDPSEYRRLVGSLQYVTMTRPDISFAVNRACQFMQQPTSTHFLAVKRILRYLAGTKSHGITFTASQSLSLSAFSDADWASNPDDRRSTSGYCIFLGDSLVSWSSSKQKVVSRSSTESEYRSLADAAADLTWFQHLFSELHLSITSTPVLWCDNLSATHLASNPIFHARTKHIEIDFHFLRDMVNRKQLIIRHVASSDQIADILTKHLLISQFHCLCNKLTVLHRPISLRGAVSPLP